jgi:hypothetical protein
MDWSKAAAKASVGSFFVGVIGLGFLVWPHLAGIRPMIGWLPIILLATAVILAGILHVLAVRMTPPPNPASLTRPNPILDSPTFAGSVVVLPTPERDKRAFIQKEPGELVAPLHGQTDYTGQRLVADYLKKWIHWRVPLYDVSEVDGYPLVSAIIAGGHTQLFIMVYVVFAPGENVFTRRSNACHADASCCGRGGGMSSPHSRLRLSSGL